MKKRGVLRILLTIVMFTGLFIIGSFLPVNAAIYGDYTYELINNETEIEITGYSGSGGDIAIPSEIGGRLVTSIGDRAFSNNQLSSVVIPDSVARIGGSAFSNNQLTSVTIPNHVTSIEYYAFSNNQLSSVIIGDSVTSIDTGAFLDNQLSSVIIPDSVISIGPYAFYFNQLNSVIIGYSVTRIGEYAFEMNQLTSVTIGDSVTSIDNNAFSNNQLSSVVIPDSVTFIGESAFEMNQLTSVTIGDSVTSIENNVFNKNQLTSVTIPDKVTSIGAYAFSNNQLTDVIIPDSVTSIGYKSFGSNQLSSVIIPNGVTIIRAYAFIENKLSSVIIPDSITSIEPYAFHYNQLISVTIGNSVSSIGNFAFSFNQLSSVIIPDSITRIEPYAFYHNQLSSIIIPDNVTFMGDDIFLDNKSNPKDFVIYGKPGSRAESYANNTGHTFISIHFVPVESVSLNKTELNLIEGNMETLVATVLPEDATHKKVNWSSSNPLIATVDKEGLVIAIAEGKAIITVTTEDGYYKASCRVWIDDEIIKDYKYNFINGGTEIQITDYSGSGGDLVVPSEIEGKPVTRIGNNSFSNNQLSSVIIPDGVISIGDNSFSDNQLASAILPDSITSIGSYAFSNNQLASVILPDGITSIGPYSFSNNQLSSVIIPDSATSIGAYAFYNNQLSSVILPENITSIEPFAFYNNQLSSIILPDSITSIGYYAFRNNQLTSVTIPDSVTSIGESAFYNNHLSSVIIPNNVISMGKDIFSGNQSNLMDFIIYGEPGSRAESYASTSGHTFISIHYMPVVSVSLNKIELNLIEGSTETLIATVLPEEAANKKVTWTSSNPSVATVDETGLVTAAAEGEAVITVATEDGNHIATCTVTVKKPIIAVVSLSLNKTELNLLEGSTETLIARISPEEAANKKVTWTSSNPSVATVDENGLVTAVAEGEAVITVITEDRNHTTTCTVVVKIDWEEWKTEVNIVSDKIWTIEFTKLVDTEDINSNNLYITDSKNNIVPTDHYSVKYSIDNKVSIKPRENYILGNTYTLWIKDLTAFDGSILAKNVKMDFTITLVDLSEYNQVLLSVEEENYTPESWENYKAVVEDNIVTAWNTQQEIDAATLLIATAQNKLVEKNKSNLEDAIKSLFDY